MVALLDEQAPGAVERPGLAIPGRPTREAPLRSTLASLPYAQQRALVHPPAAAEHVAFNPVAGVSTPSGGAGVVQRTGEAAEDGAERAELAEDPDPLPNASLMPDVQSAISQVDHLIDLSAAGRGVGIENALDRLHDLYDVGHPVSALNLLEALARMAVMIRPYAEKVLAACLTLPGPIPAGALVGVAFGQGIQALAGVFLPQQVQGLHTVSLLRFREMARSALNRSIGVEMAAARDAILNLARPELDYPPVLDAYAALVRAGEALTAFYRDFTLDLWLNYLREDAGDETDTPTGEIDLQPAAAWPDSPFARNFILPLNSWAIRGLEGNPEVRETIMADYRARRMRDILVPMRLRFLATTFVGAGDLTHDPRNGAIAWDAALAPGLATICRGPGGSADLGARSLVEAMLDDTLGGIIDHGIGGWRP